MPHYSITKIKTCVSLLLTCVLIGCIKNHINCLVSGRNAEYEECRRRYTHYRLLHRLLHRDYKRIEAASRYKFSQARGSNWSLLMGGKFKSRMQIPDVRSCSYLLLHDRLFTTRYDEKTRKGEGEKNKMPRKKFSHSKLLKQKLRQKMVNISTGLT